MIQDSADKYKKTVSGYGLPIRWPLVVRQSYSWCHQLVVVNVEEVRTPSEQVGVDAYTKDLAEFGFLDMVSILLLESFAVRYYHTYCICLFPVPL